MVDDERHSDRGNALTRTLDSLWKLELVPPERSGPMTSRELARALIAIGIVVAISLWFFFLSMRGEPGRILDFDQLYVGASALVQGDDPYALVGPSRALPQRWNLYYPAPALVATAPLTVLSLETARVVFVASGAALFAFALAWRGGSWARWLVIGSGSWQTTVFLAQASGFLAASALLPWVGVLLIAKPNVGLAVIAGARRYRDLAWPIVGGLVLLVISFVLKPDWVPSWLAAISENRMRSAPITRPFGFLLILSILRWRRPEARIFLILSIVTQTPHIYDLLLLFLIPKAPLEHFALVVMSRAAMTLALADNRWTEIDSWLVAYGELTIYFMFLPCLLMLLRRPNDGPAPAWLERRIARWPTWLRGRPVPAVAPIS